MLYICTHLQITEEIIKMGWDLSTDGFSSQGITQMSDKFNAQCILTESKYQKLSSCSLISIAEYSLGCNFSSIASMFQVCINHLFLPPHNNSLDK